MKNKYIYRSKILESRFREILRLFLLDLTVTQVAEITHISRNTINTIFNKIRVRIFEIYVNEFPVEPEKEEFEVDESYFGPRRVRGRRGYDGLVDLGYEKHFRVEHGENEFSDGAGNHNEQQVYKYFRPYQLFLELDTAFLRLNILIAKNYSTSLMKEKKRNFISRDFVINFLEK